MGSGVAGWVITEMLGCQSEITTNVGVRTLIAKKTTWGGESLVVVLA